MARPGLFGAFLRFYRDPRGSVRAVLEANPAEAKLLVILMLAMALIFCARIVQIHVQFQNPDDRLELIMQQMVSQLLFLPLFYYGLAALVTAVSRLCGGVGGWKNGRVAVFWSTLVAAPVVLMSLLLPLVTTAWPMAILPVVIAQLGSVFLAWALAQSIAAAFEFTRTWLVFACVCLPAAVLFVVAWLLRS